MTTALVFSAGLDLGVFVSLAAQSLTYRLTRKRQERTDD